MSGALERVLAKLPNAKQTRDYYMASCPAHDDRNPSLSVKQGMRGAIVKCHAGCTQEAVIAALGLAASDLFDDEPKRSSANGTRKLSQQDADVLLANRGLRPETIRHFRIETCLESQEWKFPLGKDLGFKFKAFAPNGRGEERKYRNPTGVPVGAYCLKLCANQPEAYLLEGEADVWVAAQASLPAFTFTGGAGVLPPDGVADIAKANIGCVRICYDRDKSGREGAAKVSAAFTKANIKHVILELPAVLGEKGDVTNLYVHLGNDDAKFRTAMAALPTAGAEAAALRARELAAEQCTVAIKRGEADYSKEPKWPWEHLNNLIGPVLPGELVVVGARPACGKSTFVLNLVDGYTPVVPWAFAGTEMSVEQLRRGFAAHRLGLNKSAVLRNAWDRLPTGSKERVDEDIRNQTTALAQRAVFIDTPRLDVRTMREAIELAASLACRVFVLDQLHAMSFSGANNLAHEMGEAVRLAKELARQHQLIVILAAELNRPEREGAELGDYVLPPMSALKGTGALEEASDTVLLLSKALKQTTTPADLKAVRMQQKPLVDVIEPNVMSVKVAKLRLDGSVAGQVAWLQLDATGRLTEWNRTYLSGGVGNGP